MPFIFTRITPAQKYTYPSSYAPYSSVDYLEAVAQQAAEEYAAAHARVEAFRRSHQRESAFPPHCHSMSDSSPHRRGPPYHTGYGSYMRPEFNDYSLQDLAQAVWRDEEREREVVFRQREAARQRAIAEAARQRALAEAAAREEAVRRARARVEAQRQQDALMAILRLAAYAPVRASSTPVQAQQTPTPVAEPQPVDRKGKGKAVEVPVAVEVPIVPASSPAPAPAPVPAAKKALSLKEELEARIRVETDPEVQESLVILYSDLFDSVRSTQPSAGSSGIQRDPVPAPAAVPAPTEKQEIKTETAPKPTSKDTGAPLHRTPALPPAVAEKLLKFYHARRARRLSLQEIASVEDALRAVEGEFKFPEKLDFLLSTDDVSSAAGTASETETDSVLAYTTNNTPVHAYENALTALLTRLDAVESNGDEAVRGRRREVVREVERALDAVERRVEEGWERERSRSRSRESARRASVSESELTVRPSVGLSSAAPAAPTEDVVEKMEECMASVNELKVDTVVVSTPPADAADEDHESGLDSPIAGDAHPDDEPVLFDTATADPLIDTFDQADDGALDADPATYDADFNCREEGISIWGSDGADLTSYGIEASADAGFSRLDGANDQIKGSSEPALEDYEVSDMTTSPEHVADSEVFSSVDASRDTPAAESDASPETQPALGDATSPSTPASAPSVTLPEPISREPSSMTDMSEASTFVTATDASDAPSFVTAPFEAATSSPTASLVSPSPNTSTEAFLLSSRPFSGDAPKRRPSAGEDELEIISKDELEAAGSDWSDVESEL